MFQQALQPAPVYIAATPAPARTIRRRSYKNFDSEEYLQDLSKVNWSDVLVCPELDLATEIFTSKLKSVLDVHAPWVKFQKRKLFCPWLTKETKQMMQQRDKLKQRAKDLALRDSNLNVQVSEEQQEAWKEFKDLRNKVNNTKKNNDHNFRR